MSNPQNQLAKYRSYSYYHVLAICDSTDTASALSSMQSDDVWQHATDSDVLSDDMNTLGKYATKTLPNTGGRYCILINGSTDAAFTITKAKWTSATATSATMNDKSTSIALEGSLSISEPRGIIFLDQVVRCCLSLGVDSANAFWALKTFFVGYTFTPEDGDGVDHITDIPPVIFLAYDVVGSFDAEGGKYEIGFVAGANGAARLPHYSKSSTAINITANNSLAATLQSLAKNVNENYDRYYRCVEDQLKVTKGAEDIVKSIRRVTYSIDCGEPYLSDLGGQSPNYTVTDQSAQLKTVVGCESPANLHISAGVSIEDAIHRILGACKQVKDEASIGVDGKKYITKIQNWVESKPKPGTNTNELEFFVGYRVERQEQPRSVTFEDYNTGGDPTAKQRENLIEFDYIYTGKNIDILEFDVKMNMGMVYLQGMTITNPYKQPGQPVPVSGTAIAQQDIARQHGNNIPIFFGTQIKTANIKDTSNTQVTAQHAYSMSKHASLEMLEASVKITGNSQLLGSVNFTTNPAMVSKMVVQPEKLDNFSRFSQWATSPAFAKINIKMPRNNDDVSLFTGSQTGSDAVLSNDYAVDFWFTGYYYILQIDHVFDNGEFYQILEGLSIPEKNSFKTDTNQRDDRNITLNAQVKTCYDNSIGCGNTTSTTGQPSTSSVVVVPEKTPDTETPIAKQDVVDSSTNSKDSKDLNNIKGYVDAKQSVKDAIHEAAVKNKVDEFTLAQFAAIESKFGTDRDTYKEGLKGANGLFQFEGPTWRQYGNGADIHDDKAQADAAARYIIDNATVLRKQRPGQEVTASALYLMHNQGNPSSLKQVDSGNGNDLIPNPTHVINQSFMKGFSHPTYADLVLGAKTYMASCLINGAPYDKYDKANIPIGGSRGSISEGGKQQTTNSNMLSSTKSCVDAEKTKNDPTKVDNCTQAGNNNSTDGNSTSGNSTNTNQTIGSKPTGQVVTSSGSLITSHNSANGPTQDDVTPSLSTLSNTPAQVRSTGLNTGITNPLITNTFDNVK